MSICRAFERRRCLVLVDNFFEWKKTASGKRLRTPMSTSRRTHVCHCQRDRWFADSALEGTGFEPPVPP
jgi:putative SOS response-associated peptidase YedK